MKYPSMKFWITGLVIGVAIEYGAHHLLHNRALTYAGAGTAYIALMGLLFKVMRNILKK